jgi:hypothetical protein
MTCPNCGQEHDPTECPDLRWKIHPTYWSVPATESHDWQCGCGHWNGSNLSLCAQCGRRPGER